MRMTTRKWRLVLLIAGAVFVIGLGWYRSKLKITRNIMLRSRSKDHLNVHTKKPRTGIIALIHKHRHSKWAEMQQQKEGLVKMLKPLERAKVHHKVKIYPGMHFALKNRSLRKKRLQRVRGFLRIQDKARRIARLHAKRIAQFHKAQRLQLRKIKNRRALRRH